MFNTPCAACAVALQRLEIMVATRGLLHRRQSMHRFGKKDRHEDSNRHVVTRHGSIFAIPPVFNVHPWFTCRRFQYSVALSKARHCELYRRGIAAPPGLHQLHSGCLINPTTAETAPTLRFRRPFRRHSGCDPWAGIAFRHAPWKNFTTYIKLIANYGMFAFPPSLHLSNDHS